MNLRTICSSVCGLLIIQGCGLQSNSLAPENVPLQRQSTPTMEGRPLQAVVPGVWHDWKTRHNKNSGSSLPHTDQNSPATHEQVQEIKLVPDRSFNSIWIHIFPVFKASHSNSMYAREMSGPDPYTATGDLSSIRFHSDSGFRIAKLNDGKILSQGHDLAFSLQNSKMTIDGKDFDLGDIFLSPISGEEATQVKWDKNPTYKYRGGFVITKDLSPSEKPCLRVVNVVDFDTYISDVVPAEMPTEYPLEAVKVQAVAARTYALNKMLQNRCDFDVKAQKCRLEKPLPFDIFSSTQDQMYLGIAKEDERSSEATRKTSGMIVTYYGQVIQAMYHANSGGRTCSYADCQGGGNIPYLKSVQEPNIEAVRDIPGGTNVQRVTSEHFCNALKEMGINIPCSGDLQFIPTERNSSLRVVEAEARGSNGSARLDYDIIQKIRRKFGIPSMYLANSSSTGGKFEFISYGWGHGVGLSQEGARLQAKSKSFSDILRYYYSGTEITKLSDIDELRLASK